MCIESTITARDSELNSLSRVAVVASNLLKEEEEEQGAGRSVQHDLQPVHAILVQLAVSLQARVDQAASVKKFYYKLFLGHPVVIDPFSMTNTLTVGILKT